MSRVSELEFEFRKPPKEEASPKEKLIKKAEAFEKKLNDKLKKLEKKREQIKEMKLPQRIDISDDLKDLLEKNLIQTKEMEDEIKEVMNVVRAFETKEPIREEDFLLKLDARIKQLSRVVTDFSTDDLRKDIIVLKVALDQMNRRIIELTTEVKKTQEDGRIFELLRRVGEKIEEFEFSLAGREGTGTLMRELKGLRKQIKGITAYYENRIPDDWSDIKNDLDIALQKLAEIDLRMEKMEFNQEALRKTEYKIGRELENELRQLER
jgi:hypothetical protein